MELENITAEQYILAFESIPVTELEKRLIISNYDFPEYTITSRQMAQYMGFAGMAAANGNYGKLAKKFCKHFGVKPFPYVRIFCLFERRDGGWLWVLRPKVILALEKIGWVKQKVELSNAIQEVDDFKTSSEFNVSQTEREAIVKSRIGQGIFRVKLIDMWGMCCVTSCTDTNVLRASHIKPWRFSSNAERLDPYNGLLLLPNLDALFDLGLISFRDNGWILISGRLNLRTLRTLGIYSKMRIKKLDEKHLPYLKYHRDNIIKP